MKRRLRVAAYVLMTAVGFDAGAQILLNPGQTSRLTLGGNEFTNDIAIDVPANAQQLRIQTQANGGVDIDLLIRHGDAFPVNGNAGVFGGVDWLFEHAHYRSISAGSDERVVITRLQPQPLRTGRWHVSLLNFSAQTAAVDITAHVETSAPGSVPISVAFDDTAGCAAQDAVTTPWFDATPVTPVANNNGTTRGEQRRNAFNHAVSQLRSQLTGPAPIRILACWAALGGDAQRATLASAGPTTVFRDNAVSGTRFISMPFLPKTYTWYSSAGSAQMAGTDRCRFAGGPCNRPDIFIQFNSDVDGDVALGSSSFHYGLSAPEAGDRNVDFVTTAMHEITHGLGFVSLLNLDPDQGPVGAKFSACFNDGYCEPAGHDDAFADAVAYTDGATPRPLNALTDDERAAALTSVFDLRWTDAPAVESALNPRRAQPFPQNLPALYAPASIEGGSTLSHLDSTYTSQLMTPFLTDGLRSQGLARPMLSAVGWPESPAPVPAVHRPYGGQWFDPSRSGHGIDLHRVEGTPDTYMLVFYTFDSQGAPEWYLAIGRIVDGVFRPGDDAAGNSLWRTRYLPGSPPGQEPDTTVPGSVRIDFNQAARAPACTDGTGRNAPLALMTFSLGNDTDLTWCLTQIAPESTRPAMDRTGHWFAGSSDAGWGVTVLGYQSGAADGVFMVLYYPDSAGRPRWAAAQDNTFESGTPMALMQVQGYCRTCARPPGGNPAIQVGTVTLTLDEPEGSDGEIRFDVEFAGQGGGRFTRASSPMIRIAESEPAGD
jgi:hypothetical protein